MKKNILLIALFMFNSSLAFSQTYDEMFNLQRALHGKGHVFTYEGKQYTTDHPEEIEAQAVPTEANAKALLASAKDMRSQASKLSYDWTLTTGLIKKASSALKKGEFQKSMDLSAQAKYHARMSIAQYHSAKEEWINMVPK